MASSGLRNRGKQAAKPEHSDDGSPPAREIRPYDHPNKAWSWVFASDAYSMGKADTMEERLAALHALPGGKTADLNKTFEEGALAAVQPISLAEEIVAVLFLFLCPGAALWVPVVSLVLLCLALLPLGVGWVPFATFAAVMFAVWCVPSNLVSLETFHRSFVHRAVLKYFSFKVAWCASLDPSRQHVLAASPHGAFPFGNLLVMTTIPVTAGFTFHGIAATAALQTPFLKQGMGWMGCIDASGPVVRKHMAKGASIGLNPGGILEMFHPPTEDTETIVLGNRKGFVKVALERGAVLVPGYCFGNNPAMRVYSDPCGVLKRVSQLLRVSLVLIGGRLGLPVPNRTPIAAVSSEPILLPRIPNPTKEDVDFYHAEFVRRLTHVFDMHKKAYGWEHKRLVVL